MGKAALTRRASTLGGLEPWLRPYAEALVQLGGAQVSVTSARRTWGQQLRLWLNRWRNPYPVAPPGQSYHEYGRAFDLAGPPELLHRLGAVWRSWGGTWYPSDQIHFQA